jgi:cbb3-type cytochrome oxidase maturation protein
VRDAWRCIRGFLDILFILVPLGMALVALGLWAFFWAVGSGQFDDLDSPGWSVLRDEDFPDQAPKKKAESDDQDGAG